MSDPNKSRSLIIDDLSQKKLKQIVIWIIVVVLLLWVGSGFGAYLLLDNWSDRGAFGDTFGFINVLFSGLAFVGIILAIILQSKELEYQRKELQQTRAEIRGQKEQLQAQNETLRRQNFESTLFQMLRLHHDIINAIDIEHGGWGREGFTDITEKGRDAFVYLFSVLAGRYSQSQIGEGLEKVDAEYEELYTEHQTDIGHYFRNLYNIIKFIDRKGPAQFEEKYVYTSLVRAQLSSHELLLLFYNSLSRFGRDKFKPLIEKYHLLKNMPLNEIIQPEHEAFYNSSAFKKPGTSQTK